ncbi:MAG: serine/threonine-protein kinase [Gemmatimonadota bacterium]|nr:serine/threonine-protein kinase [Gemmatimonadota bacterium]
MTTTCGACGAVITGGAMDAERMERVRIRLQQGIGDGYQLGDMLGRGGMGIVFQARELSLDRDVALKVLAFDPLLNPDAYARFEREAKLAARLDHPNIVPIFAVGQGNGIAFYTMRMVRGGSVEALVSGGQALTMSRAIAILDDVAKALDYAHAHGVVHRDIKPANVLLSDSGHAMVADFGIARAFGGTAGGTSTATGTGVVGSPAYMSPEQWRGEKVDGRADQYALGVLAFELLTGSRPFKGDSMQELLRMHLQDDAPDIISVRHDLPSRLTDPIRRALSKDPNDRYASAAEFVAALNGATVAPARLASASTVAASAPTVRTPMPPPPVRARAPGSATASQTIAAPAGAGGSRRVTTAPGVRETDDAPAKRSLVPWLVLLVIAGAGAGVIWKLAPPRVEAPPAVQAPPASAPADTVTDMERRLQSQIEETRRIALAAERRADSLAELNRSLGAGTAAAGNPRPAPAAEPPHAHLYVFAQGGAAQVVLDGQVRGDNAPAVYQVAPGRHRVSVRGAQEFVPAETTVVLAVNDTQSVIFRTRRVAAADGVRGGMTPTNVPGVSALPPSAIITENAPPDAAALIVKNPSTGQATVNWPAVIRRLGFDPRSVDQRSLSPTQRAGLRRFQQMMDSLRRAGTQIPGRKPQR